MLSRIACLFLMVTLIAPIGSVDLEILYTLLN